MATEAQEPDDPRRRDDGAGAEPARAGAARPGRGRDLDGKVALVTGGTGALGEAICRALAREGADVAFTYGARETRAVELGEELERAGVRALFGRVAARDRSAIDAFCARVEAELGRVDVLVNNLGAAQVLPFALIEERDWDEALGVNLTSMFLFSKAVVRGMVRRRAGVIVNVGSLAGHRLVEAPVHYATAKAGVAGFTRALAGELGRFRVRVVEVAPGLVDGGVGRNVSDAQRRHYAEHNASSRTGRPEEIAELVAFLASERASYVNATTVAVDGGL